MYTQTGFRKHCDVEVNFCSIQMTGQNLINYDMPHVKTDGPLSLLNEAGTVNNRPWKPLLGRVFDNYHDIKNIQ